MAAALRGHLDAPVHYPRFSDEDMSYDAWRREVSGHLEALGPHVAVVAHSFGASVALRHVLEDRPSLSALVLLAMPYWGTTGWDVAEYAPPAAFEPPVVPIFLHHCRDDEEAPIDHLAHHVAALPGAAVREHETGGHQLSGRMAAVAADLSAS